MEKDKIKTPRASQSRDKQKRPTTWTPPSSLDAPPAPDGYRHRWIRTEVLGFDDTKNMSGKIRSGWELVRADEYPDYDYPSIKDGKYAGVIGVGGLILAKMPTETVAERRAYYSQLANDQMDAVDQNLMRESNPIMPIDQPNRTTKVTFGSGGSKG